MTEHFRYTAALLLICSLFSVGGVNAQQSSLQVAVSSPSHTETLLLQQDGDEINWKIILPRRLAPRGGLLQGRVPRGDSTLRGEFSSILEMQSDGTQRSRLEGADNNRPTFSLYYYDAETHQITWPLTNEEHVLLLKSEIMQAIAKDIDSKKILLKPHLILDLLSPQRRDSILRKPETGNDFKINEECMEKCGESVP